jgi:hypothetical protein
MAVPMTPRSMRPVFTAAAPRGRCRPRARLRGTAGTRPAPRPSKARRGNLVAVAPEKLRRLELDVAQQFLYGVAVARLHRTRVTALGRQLDIHRVGITEEVVHIAEDLLVGADQDHTEQVGLILPHLVQRQARPHAVPPST